MVKVVSTGSSVETSSNSTSSPNKFLLTAAMVSSVISQYFYPRYIIESFATSLTVLFVVLYVQRPEMQIDMSTGLPGYRAYCEEIGKIRVTGHDTRIVMISLRNAAETRLPPGSVVFLLQFDSISISSRLHGNIIPYPFSVSFPLFPESFCWRSPSHVRHV
jgi:hypothetical protein